MPAMIKFVCPKCGAVKRRGERSFYTAKELYCNTCHAPTLVREPSYCRITIEKHGTHYYRLVRVETNINERRGRVTATVWSGTAARSTCFYTGEFLNRHQAHQLTQDTSNTVVGLQPEDQDLPYFYNSSIYDSIHP